jgi:predicted nucleic-acid-binding Zn-ribbon protein
MTTEPVEPDARRKCAKCGSEDVTPARPLETSEGEVFVRVKLGGFFSRSVKSRLKTSICTQCGFTELNVEKLAAMRKIYLDSKR